MLKVGDYVLIHNIQNVEGTTMNGEPLPVWGLVTYTTDEDGKGKYDYGVTLCHSGAEGDWGIDEGDIVPEAVVTDEQWAALTKWRLTDG
jgi:hypothetical protein